MSACWDGMGSQREAQHLSDPASPSCPLPLLVLTISLSCWIFSAVEQKTGLLPYFIALDHSSRSVVLCIRGTMSVADCLTDVQFDPAPLGSFLQAESLRSLKRTKPFACKSSGVSKEREVRHPSIASMIPAALF